MQSIGTLVLIYDENLEFIDENWVLNVDSPGVEAKRALPSSEADKR